VHVHLNSYIKAVQVPVVSVENAEIICNNYLTKTWTISL
jgi:hypothetical protein